MTVTFDESLNNIILKLNKQPSSISLASRHSIQSSVDSNRYYQRRVSFDNVTNIPPADQSFTLKQSSQGFERTKRSRTLMVALDLNGNRLDALAFTLTSLIDEGDEIIVVAVYSPNYLGSTDTIAAPDMDISPRDKAQEIMDLIVGSHQGDNIHMVVELSFHRPEIALEDMIRMYQPSMLIVGSRNKTKYKHAYSGAGIFKYRLKHSTVPVVIVRDTPKQKEVISIVDDTKNNVPMSKRMKKTLSLFNCTV